MKELVAYIITIRRSIDKILFCLNPGFRYVFFIILIILGHDPYSASDIVIIKIRSEEARLLIENATYQIQLWQIKHQVWLKAQATQEKW